MGYATLYQQSTITANTHSSGLLLSVGERATGDFYKGGDADAEEWAILIFSPFLLFLPPFGIVRQFQYLCKGCLIVTTIIGNAMRGAVGKGIGRNQIATAYLSGIEVQFMGDTIHCTF